MKTETVGVLALGLVVGVVVGVVVGSFGLSFQTQSLTTGTGTAEVLTADEAGNATVDFIMNYGGLPPGVEVELVNATEVEGAGLYKVAFNISSAFGISQPGNSYISRDGKLIFPTGIEVEEFKKMVEEVRTIGNFKVSEDEVCREGSEEGEEGEEGEEKPIIYFFGSEGCGYCKWEHPVFQNVTAKFEGFISLHDNMGNFSAADREIFEKYNPGGGVPTLVLGCKYYRPGAGTNLGEEQEAKVLTALICNLTDGKPVEVCSDPEVEDLMSKI
ncbi:MAG: thioredoxin family protein [Methanophagales archaeon]|nr:thioredoxin family protein [Methanophagales archaeon]